MLKTLRKLEFEIIIISQKVNKIKVIYFNIQFSLYDYTKLLLLKRNVAIKACSRYFGSLAKLKYT